MLVFQFIFNIGMAVNIGAKTWYEWQHYINFFANVGRELGPVH